MTSVLVIGGKSGCVSYVQKFKIDHKRAVTPIKTIVVNDNIVGLRSCGLDQ